MGQIDYSGPVHAHEPIPGQTVGKGRERSVDEVILTILDEMYVVPRAEQTPDLTRREESDLVAVSGADFGSPAGCFSAIRSTVLLAVGQPLDATVYALLADRFQKIIHCVDCKRRHGVLWVGGYEYDINILGYLLRQLPTGRPTRHFYVQEDGVDGGMCAQKSLGLLNIEGLAENANMYVLTQ